MTSQDPDGRGAARGLSASGDAWRAALGARRFLLQACARCGRSRWYPRARCPGCGSAEAAPLEADGTGTVFSLSRVAVNAEPGFEGQAPYLIALIRLLEGPSVVARIVAADADRCAIGSSVEPDWTEPGDPTPRFRLRGEERPGAVLDAR